MNIEAKARLTAAPKNKDIEGEVIGAQTELHTTSQNLRRIYNSLSADHPKKELLRRGIARVEDAIDDLMKVRSHLSASAVTAAMTRSEWRTKSGKLNEALDDADRALGTAESDLDEVEPDDDPAWYKKQQKLITQLKKKYEDAKQKVADHMKAGKDL